MAGLLIETHLAKFLLNEASKTLRWGEWDCGLRIADWLVERLGVPDPAVHLRGRYHDQASCETLIGSPYPLVIARLIRSAGLKRTIAPTAGDPGAHGRAHQDQLVPGQLVDDGQSIVAPAAHRALGEVARRLPVAEVVEADERTALAPGPLGQRLGLGPGHVGAEAAQPHARGRGALNRSPGPSGPIRPFEISPDQASWSA